MFSLAAFLIVFVSIIGFSCSGHPSQPMKEVSFETADGSKIFANLYGQGSQAVILAHGAVFNKESWDPFAKRLAEKGLLVLALDFRGYGKSVAGSNDKALYEDILGALHYLQKEEAISVSVIGGSMGGGAVALASVRAKPGELDRMILLSSTPIDEPEKMKANHILFIASKEEKLVPRVKEQYERAPEPKKLELINGGAHAQHIFKTEQSEKLISMILSFLKG